MIPLASIIIPHFRDHRRLRLCLAALERCYELQRCEVIVIDSGPQTIPVALKQCFGFVRFAHEEKPGAALARNSGVALSRGTALFFLDSDCIPDRNFIEQGLHALSQAHVIGGDVRVFDETEGPKTGAEAFEAVFAFNQKSYIEQKGFAVTANLVTTRRVFELVGPFRNGVSEDLEWCQRATAHGYILKYWPSMIVHHPSRSDWAALKRKWARITRETHRLRVSNMQTRLKWCAVALIMPLSILLHTPRILATSRLQCTSERLKALYTLARLRLWRSVEMLRVNVNL